MEGKQEVGSEFADYRRRILRQHFYGLVTGTVKAIHDAGPELLERDGPSAQLLKADTRLLMKLCQIDGVIQIAEEMRRANDMAEKAQKSSDLTLPANVDALGLAMRRLSEIMSGKADPLQEALQKVADQTRSFAIEYVCRRCGHAGETQTLIAPTHNNLVVILAGVLVDHSKHHGRCAADKEDIVLRPFTATQKEWEQTLEEARQASELLHKRVPPPEQTGDAETGGKDVA